MAFSIFGLCGFYSLPTYPSGFSDIYTMLHLTPGGFYLDCGFAKVIGGALYRGKVFIYPSCVFFFLGGGGMDCVFPNITRAFHSARCFNLAGKSTSTYPMKFSMAFQKFPRS